MGKKMIEGSGNEPEIFHHIWRSLTLLLYYPLLLYIFSFLASQVHGTSILPSISLVGLAYFSFYLYEGEEIETQNETCRSSEPDDGEAAWPNEGSRRVFNYGENGHLAEDI